MKYENIFENIDALFDSYVGVLADVCNIESPTADKAAVDECGRYFAEFAKDQRSRAFGRRDS